MLYSAVLLWVSSMVWNPFRWFIQNDWKIVTCYHIYSFLVIEAMPEEVVPDMQSLVEKEIKEEQKQQIKEHVWGWFWMVVFILDWHDDLVMIILLLIIFVTLGGMIWISYKLISNDERFSRVSYKHFKSDPVSLDHCTSSSTTHFHLHLQTLLHLRTNPHSSADP